VVVVQPHRYGHYALTALVSAALGAAAILLAT
jgi:hypothetical protein